MNQIVIEIERKNCREKSKPFKNEQKEATVKCLSIESINRLQIEDHYGLLIGFVLDNKTKIKNKNK